MTTCTFQNASQGALAASDLSGQDSHALCYGTLSVHGIIWTDYQTEMPQAA